MAGESNWVTHVQGAAGSSWVQLRAPYPYQRCAFALKMQPRRDADSPDGAPARERWPVLPVGAFTPAPPRTAGREGVTPTAKKRGDGLERRPPVGTARRRRAESRIAKDRDSSRLGTVPIPGRSAFPCPAALLLDQHRAARPLRGAVPAGGRRSKPSPRFFSLGDVRLRGLVGRACRPEAGVPIGFSAPVWAITTASQWPIRREHLGVPSAVEHLAWTCAPTDGRDGSPVRESAPPSAQYRRRQRRGRPAKPQQSTTLEGTRR